MTPKIAASLSLLSALLSSLVSYGPAQSAPLISLALTKPGVEQNEVQVRWRRGWHGRAGFGVSSAPPQYYGGSYFGYTYDAWPGSYGYRPFGWHY